MIKKLYIIVLIIIFSSNAFIKAQSDKILLKGECSIENVYQLTNLLSENSLIELDISIQTNDFLNFPIIILCSNEYLKLTEIQIAQLRKNLLNGSLLIVDNYKSDYTFSIFLKKLLPEYRSTESLFSEIFLVNPYNLNISDDDLKSKQIFIREKLRVIAFKNKILLNEEDNQSIEFIKSYATILFNYLIGN
tara:strand:- start:640 stop:1212 length:573 start_codon:yes stop_codon:yes gene_type:complete